MKCDVFNQNNTSPLFFYQSMLRVIFFVCVCDLVLISFHVLYTMCACMLTERIDTNILTCRNVLYTCLGLSNILSIFLRMRRTAKDTIATCVYCCNKKYAVQLNLSRFSVYFLFILRNGKKFFIAFFCLRSF